jgi:hypothetical protein
MTTLKQQKPKLDSSGSELNWKKWDIFNGRLFSAIGQIKELALGIGRRRDPNFYLGCN